MFPFSNKNVHHYYLKFKLNLSWRDGLSLQRITRTWSQHKLLYNLPTSTLDDKKVVMLSFVSSFENSFSIIITSPDCWRWASWNGTPAVWQATEFEGVIGRSNAKFTYKTTTWKTNKKLYCTRLLWSSSKIHFYYLRRIQF